MRATRSLATVALTFVATACGANAATEPPTHAASAPSPSNAVAIVRTTQGIDAVNAATQELLWSASSAVAAPDASAVVELVADGRVARRDPRTGATQHTFEVPLGVRPVVIAPDGMAMALSDRPLGYDSSTAVRPSTRIVVVDGVTGTVNHDLTVAGDIEAEVFSLDAHNLFVLDHRGDHYRVQSLDLESGQRADVNSVDKEPPEDMHGIPVHGVMSRNRQVLATLYINPANEHSPAFVHVLHLNGWTACVDLPVEFATGPARSQTIERDDEEIVVRAAAIGTQARFSIAAATEGEAVLTVSADSGAAADSLYRARDGFVALVGILMPVGDAPPHR